MHLYAFGSVCRGDIDRHSDVDILAICDDEEVGLLPNNFASYSPEQIHTFWNHGNAFAWHLAKESRLLFSPDGDGILARLGNPTPYTDALADCRRFRHAFCDAEKALEESYASSVFELATVFLAIRNFATCFALGRESPDFSRRSFLMLGDKSLRVPEQSITIMEHSRLLSVRGVGTPPSRADVDEAVRTFDLIHRWMDNLLEDLA